MDYKNKYLKYKIKYLNLKKIFGGSDNESYGLPNFTDKIQEYTTTMLNQAPATKSQEEADKLERDAESKHAKLSERRKKGNKGKKEKKTQSQKTIIKQGNKFSEQTTVNYNIVPSHKLREGDSQNLGNLFKGMSHHEQDNVRLEPQAQSEPEPQARRLLQARRLPKARLELGLDEEEEQSEPQARLELGSDSEEEQSEPQAPLDLGSGSEEEQESKRRKLEQEEPESSSNYNLLPNLNILDYLNSYFRSSNQN